MHFEFITYLQEVCLLGGLSTVKRKWGKQRFIYHATKEWNNLKLEIKYSDNVSSFKSNFYSNSTNSYFYCNITLVLYDFGLILFFVNSFLHLFACN